MATVLIGTSSLGGNTANSNGAGVAFAQRLQCSTSGTVTTLNIRTGALDTATSIHCALYADNAGAISSASRLSDDKTTASNYTANSVNTYTLGTPVAVSSGTFYWIEFLAIAGVFNYTNNAASGGTEQDTSAQSTCPATHAASTSPNANIANVWAEGTTPGGLVRTFSPIPFM